MTFQFMIDGCLGDDVARWLMEQLRSRGSLTDAELGQEDVGWHFGFQADGTKYHFIVGYRSAEGGVPAAWIGW